MLEGRCKNVEMENVTTNKHAFWTKNFISECAMTIKIKGNMMIRNGHFNEKTCLVLKKRCIQCQFNRLGFNNIVGKLLIRIKMYEVGGRRRQRDAKNATHI